MRIVYTEDALHDLDEARSFIGANYPTVVAAFLNRLRVVERRIGQWLESAQAVEQRPGIRAVPFVRYPTDCFIASRRMRLKFSISITRRARNPGNASSRSAASRVSRRFRNPACSPDPPRDHCWPPESRVVELRLNGAFSHATRRKGKFGVGGDKQRKQTRSAMSRLKIGLAAAAMLLSTSMLSGASAMPAANGLAPAATQAASGIQKVRWVCGPYRCWWAPGPYWRGGPRWGWGGWGWRDRWGWHRGWGWHGRRW
jgi:plasmid stabilization system protein ParE